MTADAQQYVQDVPGPRGDGCRGPRRGGGARRDGDVDAAIVGDSAIADRLHGHRRLERADPADAVARRAPDRRAAQPRRRPTPALRYLVAIGFGIVFLLAASLFGGTIAQSVVEEKQTRVVELLISAIPARALLAGQGHRQHRARDGADPRARRRSRSSGSRSPGRRDAAAGTRRADRRGSRSSSSFGFVLLASLFAAAAAMVSRQEDIGSTTMPAHDAHHGAVLPRDLLQRQPDGARDHVVRAVLGSGRHADAAVPRRGPVVGAAAVARDPDRDAASGRSSSARGSTRTRCCGWAGG